MLNILTFSIPVSNEGCLEWHQLYFAPNDSAALFYSANLRRYRWRHLITREHNDYLEKPPSSECHGRGSPEAGVLPQFAECSPVDGKILASCQPT